MLVEMRMRDTSALVRTGVAYGEIDDFHTLYLDLQTHLRATQRGSRTMPYPSPPHPLNVLRLPRPDEVVRLQITEEEAPSVRRFLNVNMIEDIPHWTWEEIFEYMEDTAGIP